MGITPGQDKDDRITGGTDGTPIGNVGDRLKVDAVLPNTPASLVVWKTAPLMNGSNKSMDVNGSSTSQAFRFTPAASEVWWIKSVSLFLIDSGSLDFNDFGSIGGGLSNGLQLNVRTNGTAYEIGNYTDNAELESGFYHGNGVVPGDDGWMDSTGWRSGSLVFDIPMKLDNATSDYIEFLVRDNITGLDQMCAQARLFREI